MAADSTRSNDPGSHGGRVLLDAPCTGLGALRRRPEVRWRRTPDDVPPLVELQTALLDSALRSVRVGGVVAYVTCSPHTAETVEVVGAAAARDDVEIVPVAPLFPEVRWRRTADDVAPLAALQTALLDSALAAVRVGGVVAYVTCSPHTAETVDVVDAAAARDDVEVLPVAPLFPDVPDMARGEYGQLWPHRHGTDAMFMALLRRTR